MMANRLVNQLLILSALPYHAQYSTDYHLHIAMRRYFNQMLDSFVCGQNSAHVGKKWMILRIIERCDYQNHYLPATSIASKWTSAHVNAWNVMFTFTLNC